jgi:hypothetical protein
MLVPRTGFIAAMGDFVKMPSDHLVPLQTELHQEALTDVDDAIIGADHQDVFLNELVDDGVIHGPRFLEFLAAFSLQVRDAGDLPKKLCRPGGDGPNIEVFFLQDIVVDIHAAGHLDNQIENQPLFTCKRSAYRRRRMMNEPAPSICTGL